MVRGKEKRATGSERLLVKRKRVAEKGRNFASVGIQREGEREIIETRTKKKKNSWSTIKGESVLSFSGGESYLRKKNCEIRFRRVGARNLSRSRVNIKKVGKRKRGLRGEFSFQGKRMAERKQKKKKRSPLFFFGLFIYLMRGAFFFFLVASFV